MTTNFEDVGEFHHRFDLPCVLRYGNVYVAEQRPGQRAWDDEFIDFRTKFMHEELKEFEDAVEGRDHAKMFDALLDLVYVAMGTAHGLGYPWQEGWDEVQRANMAKVRAAKDGSDSVRGSAFDVVKPAGWAAPDIESVLERHGFSGFSVSPGIPVCALCRRARAAGLDDHPMDAYDYSPLQVIGGKPVGWYSDDDSEICPECMTRTLANQ